MPNRPFNCRKMRPKPLRPQVKLGPALTMWQCVNEVPSLVALKRQTTLRSRMQHRTPTHSPPLGVNVNMSCCIAKADRRRRNGTKSLHYGSKIRRKAKIPSASQSLSERLRWRRRLRGVRCAPIRAVSRARPEVSRPPLLLPGYGYPSSRPHR